MCLGICRQCATVQLVEPFPREALVCPFDWIGYCEPEDHLDAVVAEVLRTTDVGPGTRVGGLTAKDRSTLERFVASGCAASWCLDVHTDLGAVEPNAGVESVAALLNRDRADWIAANRGTVDVLIARHIVEHAADAKSLLTAMRGLLRDGGTLVAEVPDCMDGFEKHDYPMIWEEHCVYLTESTFGSMMARAGFETISSATYRYPFENVLVQIARKTGHDRNVGDAADVLGTEHARYVGFVEAMPAWTDRYRHFFERERELHPVALYGAGHLTAAFVNLHRLGDLFAFVVDDAPQKQGLYLPGSGLPIVSRAALEERGIGLCVLGISASGEDKVVASNHEFEARGGRFRSMFANSSRTVRNDLETSH